MLQMNIPITYMHFFTKILCFIVQRGFHFNEHFQCVGGGAVVKSTERYGIVVSNVIHIFKKKFYQNENAVWKFATSFLDKVPLEYSVKMSF